MMDSPAPTVTRHVVAITGGKNVPSRRFRVKALLPHLRELGIAAEELCAGISSYPPPQRWLRPAWFAAALAERLTYTVRARNYEAVILQRELISTLATVERLLPEPRILDVDDAIFLYRNGKAAQSIAAGCALVVCGNEYLADRFSKWNAEVAVIPTGVDTDRLRPREARFRDDSVRIGWIGTVSNFKYLEQIKPEIARVMHAHKQARFRLVSSECPSFFRDLGEQFEFVRWSPGIEETEIPGFTIGIMPLQDSEWTRGKCAFKMLQYMAAGVPVVASDVGMSASLLRQADIGVGVSAGEDWAGALEQLMHDAEMRRRLGDKGRELAVSEYSLSRVAELWKEQIERVA